MTVPEAQLQGVELLPCPFCGPGQSCVDLYFDDTAYRYRVGCGRCGCSTGISPRDVTQTPAIAAWNTRAAIPRATADARAGDVYIDYEQDPITGEIFTVQKTTATPRTTGETTVETALVELREMFPKTFIRVRSTTEIEYNEYVDKASYRERHAYVLIMKHGEFSAQTLADCMAQVRAATRTEGEGEKP
jgi:hypothetical protein